MMLRIIVQNNDCNDGKDYCDNDGYDCGLMMMMRRRRIMIMMIDDEYGGGWEEEEESVSV